MNKDKFEFAKRITAVVAARKRKASFDRSIMHPEREWFIGLGLMVLLLLIGLYWSVFQYGRYNDISVAGEAVAEQVTVYKANLIEAALVDFSKRAEEYNKIKNELLGNASKEVNSVVEEVDDGRDSDSKQNNTPTEEVVGVPELSL